MFSISFPWTAAVHRLRVGPDPFGNGKGVDQRVDIRHGGMVMFVMIMAMIMVMAVIVAVLMPVIVFMMMLMIMVGMIVPRFLFLPVHGHRHMRTGDPALHGRLRAHPNAGKPQSVHPVDERLPVLCQFQQRGGQHIAGGAHAAFQIQRFHRVSLQIFRSLSVRIIHSNKKSGVMQYGRGKYIA